MSEKNMNTKIFISHRHADKDIADILSKNLKNWGIPEDDIFQSSAPGHGAKIGEKLSDEISRAVDESKIIFLVYTDSEEDWSYCTWECGVAYDPKKKIQNKKILTLQCYEDNTPKIFEDQVLIKFNENKDTCMYDFVQQFHMDEGFFPDEGAFMPKIAETAIEDKAKRLFNDLKTTIPSKRDKEERFRWDCFKLDLANDIVMQVKNENDESNIIQTLRQRCVVSDKFDHALEHFGYTDALEGLTLDDLIIRWKDETKNEESQDDWVKRLCIDIHRSIQSRPAEANWGKFNSVRVETSWFYPVLNHVRVFPNGNHQFDVYLYEVPPECVNVKPANA